jgi:CheY-like chemotaxis protein
VLDTPVPERVKKYIPAETQTFKAVGCPECSMTGYKGRFSVVEVLTMNAELERLIGGGATADKIAEAGRQNGMRSLFESGLRHVLAGETSVEELLRVVDVPMAEREAADRAIAAAARPAEPPKRKTPPGSPSVTTSAAAAPVAPVVPLPPPPAPSPASRFAIPDLSAAFELLDEDTVVEDISIITRKSGTRGRTVLLVDDEDTLRRVMRDLLVRDGYEVVEARTGVEALDQVDRHAPDVVVLDLNLPGMNGYAVLSELRSRAATREIPVIVLTAKGDEDNEVRVFELGADDFLTKPFRAKALSKRLEVVLERKRG